MRLHIKFGCCSLFILVLAGCSARQVLPEPAVETVEPGQVTLGLRDLPAEAASRPPMEQNAPSGDVQEPPLFETPPVAYSVPEAPDETNPFLEIEQTAATAPANSAVENADAVENAAKVQHADHAVAEGCAGPGCELIGCESNPAPGADQTNLQK